MKVLEISFVTFETRLILRKKIFKHTFPQFMKAKTYQETQKEVLSYVNSATTHRHVYGV